MSDLLNNNNCKKEVAQGAASACASKNACERKPNYKKRNILLFAFVSIAWLLLDRVVKIICEAASLGSVLCSDFFGLADIRLAHNYGAAWSMFEGSTTPLIVVALVICALLLVFALYESRLAPAFEMASIALVFAGGLGNMIDRILYGYVVDMINLNFIDFPIFNVADIGVTCGIVLLLLSFLMQSKGASRDA